MNKNFDAWNNEKKYLEQKDVRSYFKEAEVWWCSIGINIRTESCGKGEYFRRPVLIVKKLSGISFIGVPLTSAIKKGTWYQKVSTQDSISYAILSQVRAFDTKRLQKRMLTLGAEEFLNVKRKLKALLEL